jgi:hypothetical protein
MPETLLVDLNIPAHEFMAVYQGSANSIYAVARDGRSIQFPANNLRRFVTRDGIQGSFRIRISTDSKLLGIDRVS